MANKYLDNDGVLYLWNKIKSYVATAISGKVDSVAGKGLSTNDYTTAEKNKLSGIESGAESNVIESVKVNGSALTVTGKAVDVSVPTATSDLTNDSGFITIDQVPEGAVASATTPSMDGTASAGSETAFARGDHVHPHDNTKVDKVSGKGLSTNDYTTDEKNKLSGVASGAQVNVIETIKVNGTTQSVTDKAVDITVPTPPSVSTSTPLMDGTAAVGTSTAYARGDHRHPSDSTKVDKVTGKGLSTNDYTTAEKEKLAGLAAVATSGSYSDLSDTPTIPAVPQMATDANMSDWTSGKTVDAGTLKTNFTVAVGNLTTLGDNLDAVASALADKVDRSEIVNAYIYKGSVATTNDLPSNAESGWVYNVEASGMNYAWNGTAWDALGEIFSITAITNSEIDTICT